MVFEQFLLVASLLIFISIIISKVSYRLGIPSLLFFLLIGMLAGSEGLGGIYFDNPVITQAMGTIALVFILFSGGLDTKWGEVRPVLGQGIVLSTLGVFITAVAVGLFINGSPTGPCYCPYSSDPLFPPPMQPLCSPFSVPIELVLKITLNPYLN